MSLHFSDGIPSVAATNMKWTTIIPKIAARTGNIESRDAFCWLMIYPAMKFIPIILFELELDTISFHFEPTMTGI